MCGGVGVIGFDGADGFADGEVVHAGVLVDLGEVGAADGAVLVEEELGAVDAAVLVEAEGFLEVGDGGVVGVLLLVEDAGVEPGGGVGGVELAGEVEILAGEGVEADGAEGLAVVAVEQGALGFECGGGLEQGAAAGIVAVFDPEEAEAEPGVGEGGIEGDGVFEVGAGGSGAVVGAVEEAGEGMGLGVARGELEGVPEGVVGGGDASGGELEFGDAGPCEAGAGLE